MAAQVHAGESTILEIGISYLDEISPTLGPEIKMPLIHAMSTYLGQQSTFEQSQQIFFSIIGRSEPLDKLRDIVEQPDDPVSLIPNSSSNMMNGLPINNDCYNFNNNINNNNNINTNSNSNSTSNNNNFNNSNACNNNNSNNNNNNNNDSDDQNALNRKKTRSWTLQEDTRLLAGIYRFGADNWTTISLYIGNGRTRAQCCQRWTRGLNPRISKNLWSYEEDLRLVQLVNTYGDKSWTKIASMMGNRSDVQCRYHYHQVMRDMPPLLKKMLNNNNNLNNLNNNNNNGINAQGIPGMSPTATEELNHIRTAIEAQLPARYSLPQLSMPPEIIQNNNNNDLNNININLPNRQQFNGNNISQENMPSTAVGIGMNSSGAISINNNNNNNNNFNGNEMNKFYNNINDMSNINNVNAGINHINNKNMRSVLSQPMFQQNAFLYPQSPPTNFPQQQIQQQLQKMELQQQQQQQQQMQASFDSSFGGNCQQPSIEGFGSAFAVPDEMNSSMNMMMTQHHHHRRASMAPLPPSDKASACEKTKFPSPPKFEKSYSGTEGIDNFLKNFKC